MTLIAAAAAILGENTAAILGENAAACLAAAAAAAILWLPAPESSGCYGGSMRPFLF